MSASLSMGMGGVPWERSVSRISFIIPRGVLESLFFKLKREFYIGLFINCFCIPGEWLVASEVGAHYPIWYL